MRFWSNSKCHERVFDSLDINIKPGKKSAQKWFKIVLTPNGQNNRFYDFTPISIITIRSEGLRNAEN